MTSFGSNFQNVLSHSQDPSRPYFSTSSEEFESKKETLSQELRNRYSRGIHCLFTAQNLTAHGSAKVQAFQLAATLPWNSKINKIICVNRFSFLAFGDLLENLFCSESLWPSTYYCFHHYYIQTVAWPKKSNCTNVVVHHNNITGVNIYWAVTIHQALCMKLFNYSSQQHQVWEVFQFPDDEAETKSY